MYLAHVIVRILSVVLDMFFVFVYAGVVPQVIITLEVQSESIASDAIEYMNGLLVHRKR